MTDKNIQDVQWELKRDVQWLAQCVLDNCVVIRREGLIHLFAGDDYNAFSFIESEARRLLRENND